MTLPPLIAVFGLLVWGASSFWISRESWSLPETVIKGLAVAGIADVLLAIAWFVTKGMMSG